MVEARVSPRLDFALELRVSLGPVFELGWGSFGLRRTVPVTGGTFRGPGISGSRRHPESVESGLSRLIASQPKRTGPCSVTLTVLIFNRC